MARSRGPVCVRGEARARGARRCTAGGDAAPRFRAAAGGNLHACRAGACRAVAGRRKQNDAAATIYASRGSRMTLLQSRSRGEGAVGELWGAKILAMRVFAADFAATYVAYASACFHGPPGQLHMRQFASGACSNRCSGVSLLPQAHHAPPGRRRPTRAPHIRRPHGRWPRPSAGCSHRSGHPHPAPRQPRTAPAAGATAAWPHRTARAPRHRA